MKKKEKKKKMKSSGSLGSIVPLTVGKVIALCSAAAVTIMWETRKLNAHVAYGVTVGGPFFLMYRGLYMGCQPAEKFYDVS